MNRLLCILSISLIILPLFGCQSNNPGEWPQSQIEKKLQSKYDLLELTLAPDGAGKFSGTAKTKEGETLKISILQDPKNKSLKYDFKGDRGWYEDGKYDIDWSGQGYRPMEFTLRNWEWKFTSTTRKLVVDPCNSAASLRVVLV